MPHFAGLSAISSGLMAMQEIMMAVELAEAAPSSLVLIDGSRLSAFFSINQFYQAILDGDGRETLRQWRNQATMGIRDEPSVTITEFEDRADWMTKFLTLPNIVGNLKLVTTKSLVRRYAPASLQHRFDDQALANIVLNVGEGILVKYDHLDETGAKLPPFHLIGPASKAKPDADGYPHNGSVERILSTLHNSGPSQLVHIYARINPMHGVYKIEINEGFTSQKGLSSGGNAVNQLIDWWRWNTEAVDVMEPLPSYTADRFVKDGVKVSELALRDVLLREADSSVLWNLGSSYRT
jgi:hypothetical protein